MWDGGRGSGGAIRPLIFWCAFIAFWLLCLGAQSVQAQPTPTLSGIALEWPVVIQASTVLGGVVAVIVRINETQKQSTKDRQEMVTMWKSDVAEIKGELKDIRQQMFSRHEVEEARRTANSEHAALSQRITLLEQA